MRGSPGLIRSSMQLITVLLSVAPYGVLLAAPYRVLNEVALTWGVITGIPTLLLPSAAYYLAGDYSLYLLIASVAAASLGGAALVSLHLASSLTVTLAVLFYILYLVTHLALIKYREYPYFTSGYPVKWSIIGSLGGLVSKLILTVTYIALVAIAYTDPVPYVLAYLAAPFIGEAVVLVLAPRVSVVKPRDPSLTRGLRFTVMYHAGYAPVLLTYIVLAVVKPDWAGAFLIETLPVNLAVTYIVSNAMWGIDAVRIRRVVAGVVLLELVLLTALLLLNVFGLSMVNHIIHGFTHYVHASLLTVVVTVVAAWVIMRVTRGNGLKLQGRVIPRNTYSM